MPLGAPTKDTQTADISFAPVAFSELAEWTSDDHLAAFRAFQSTAQPVLSAAPVQNSTRPSDALLACCRKARNINVETLTNRQAREFFEALFVPHRVVHDQADGLLTGYYEPELEGSYTNEPPFLLSIFRRPPDLENVVAESERGAHANGFTHLRRKDSGETEPYFTREEIECGALSDQGLELLYLRDPVDCFFMHIQGSGLIRFPDGSCMRITYDGKNGYPYTSIGRHLINNGDIAERDMSLDVLKKWLSEDPDRGRRVMWLNKSFVFFRQLQGSEAKSAMGAQNIPLIAGRSLAVDTGYHALGTPIYVTAPTLDHAKENGNGFSQLMIASDVGSAIRGPERGDIYFGSGKTAGALAGITKHTARFFTLVPRPDAADKT